MTNPTMRQRIKTELQSAPQGLTPRDLAQRIGARSWYTVSLQCSKLYAYGEIDRTMHPHKTGTVAQATYFAKG